MLKTLIFCASSVGERVAYSLNPDKYEVIGFVDNNSEIWGRVLYGIGEVYPPSELKNIEFDLIIVSQGRYRQEIISELVNKYDIDREKIAEYQDNSKNIDWLDERLIMLRKCVSLIKDRNIKGSLAEVGVYRGDFCKYFNRFFPERKLYLFDTFCGFDSAKDDVSVHDRNLFNDTTVDIVLGKMVTPQNCIVRKGYFPDSAKEIDDNFSLVSLDCDLFNPIAAGLEFFYPKLSSGGFIFIHDFGSYHFQGVDKAVFEFCEKNNVPFFPLVGGLSAIISK